MKIFLLSVIFITFSQESYAAATSYGSAPEAGIGRERSCDVTTGDVEGLDFDPRTGGKDVEFVLSNPVCLTVILTSYAAVKIAIANMNYTCGNGSSVPRLTPSPLLDARDLIKGTKSAIGGTPACKSAYLLALSSFYVALGELRIIYSEFAQPTFNNTKVCGANWTKPDVAKFNRDAADYKQTIALAIKNYIIADRGHLNDANYSSQLALTNKTYREWYYNGVEVEDNVGDFYDDLSAGAVSAANDVANAGTSTADAFASIGGSSVSGVDLSSDDLSGSAAASTCRDPLRATSATQSYASYPKQRYYLKGLQSGNFNCKQYDIMPGQDDPTFTGPISEKRLGDFRNAYNCCRERSQNYVCIEYYDSQVFCKAGSRCTLNHSGKIVTFEAKQLDNGRLVCAQSYSLCPYNFSVGGGTEYCNYYQDGIWNSSSGSWNLIKTSDVAAGDCAAKSEIRNADCTYNAKAGKCKNYCQYLTHCTITGSIPYRYKSNIGSPYFSDACINFVGDSQNQTAYGGGGVILGSQRHFSAPIAQCVKETLENLFYNRAGHSVCLSSSAYPSADGSCPGGQYASDGTFTYKKGNKVYDKSFFETIQSNLRIFVKLVLTLSVTFYGMNILLGKSDIREKKDILLYILKIALVLYFAVGDAWQSKFFEGVYNTSTEMSRLVFKINTSTQENKKDGCQFGYLTLEDGTRASSGRLYPAGKEYLALWDTLDCKIARYLSFGPEVSAANIASLILAGFFTGPIGIYFAISVMFMGFFFIALTIMALHIFLASAISIIIMVFVSPIVIVGVLFEKTADIFKSWLTNLISFCLQPMILFAYIAILIMVIDGTLIGSATFAGPGPMKAISCSSYCQDSNGAVIENSSCDKVGQTLVNPLNDSVACLINVNDFGRFPGLEVVGLSIPILLNIFSDHVKERVLTILKGALVMYLLMKFLNEIPGIASHLTGGAQLPGSNVSGAELFNKFAKGLIGAQKRAVGLTRKVALGGKRKAGKEVESAANKGKSTEGASGDGESSSGSSSGDGPSGATDKSGGEGGNNVGDSK